MIVPMVRMKIQPFAINVIVIHTLNSNVKTANVFQNCGIVTSMMIVATILMNLHIFVEIVIVQLVGKNVHQDIIIVVFQAGFSVTVKMIVAIILMKHILNCVQNVRVPAISSAKMIVAFL